MSVMSWNARASSLTPFRTNESCSVSELQNCSPSGVVRHASVSSNPSESKNSHQVVPSRWTWTTLARSPCRWTFLAQFVLFVRGEALLVEVVPLAADVDSEVCVPVHRLAQLAAGRPQLALDRAAVAAVQHEQDGQRHDGAHEQHDDREPDAGSEHAPWRRRGISRCHRPRRPFRPRRRSRPRPPPRPPPSRCRSLPG